MKKSIVPDYDQVKRMADELKSDIHGMKQQIITVVRKLYKAKLFYTNKGYRKDLRKDGKLHSFKDFLEYVGISEEYAYRWLRQYDARKDVMIEQEKKKSKKLDNDINVRFAYFLDRLTKIIMEVETKYIKNQDEINAVNKKIFKKRVQVLLDQALILLPDIIDVSVNKGKAVNAEIVEEKKEEFKPKRKSKFTEIADDANFTFTEDEKEAVEVSEN